MSKYKSTLKTLQIRLDWLDDKIDPERGPNSAMARERRGIIDALKRIDWERKMRKFLYERELLDDFYDYVDSTKGG